MPTLITYLLEPPGEGVPFTFHFGRFGIGFESASESWPSDSLFAALVSQDALLTGTPAEINDGPPFARLFLDGSPPLVHSSLFPRIGRLLLLPRPTLQLKIPDAKLRTDIGKGFKKLRYLSPKLFEAVRTGLEVTVSPLILQGGQVWLHPDEATSLPEPWKRIGGETDDRFRSRLKTLKLWQTRQIPRVTVDRVSSASTFYEVGQVTFAEGCGLGLLVEYRNEEVQPSLGNLTARARFELLLDLLGEGGIGGKRTNGYGAFVRRIDAPYIVEDVPGSRVVLLSRYLPQRDELHALLDQQASYNLATVSGWMAGMNSAAQLRQRITLLQEGSVLVPQDKALVGQVVDIRPDYSTSSVPHPVYERGLGSTHPVYRSGLALTLPVTAEEDSHGA